MLLKSQKSQEHKKNHNIYTAEARRWNKPHLLQQYSVSQGYIEFLPVQPQLPIAGFRKVPWIPLIPLIILIPFEQRSMDTISLFKKNLAEYQTLCTIINSISHYTEALSLHLINAKVIADKQFFQLVTSKKKARQRRG